MQVGRSSAAQGGPVLPVEQALLTVRKEEGEPVALRTYVPLRVRSRDGSRLECRIQSEAVGREFPGVSLLSWERWSKSQDLDETSGWAGTEPEGVGIMLILTTSENGDRSKDIPEQAFSIGEAGREVSC